MAKDFGFWIGVAVIVVMVIAVVLTLRGMRERQLERAFEEMRERRGDGVRQIREAVQGSMVVGSVPTNQFADGLEIAMKEFVRDVREGRVVTLTEGDVKDMRRQFRDDWLDREAGLMAKGYVAGLFSGDGEILLDSLAEDRTKWWLSVRNLEWSISVEGDATDDIRFDHEIGTDERLARAVKARLEEVIAEAKQKREVAAHSA